MRWRHKVDGPQAEITAALRRVGVSVAITSSLGSGFPDLVCSHRGRTWLLEVKRSDGAPLTERERAFAQSWQGELYVVCSVEEALLTVEGGRDENG